jgi:rhodanese-related sulfurtransferase
MNDMKTIIVIAIIAGAVAGAITSTALTTAQITPEHALIKEYYDVETAVNVSPHHIRKAMAKGDRSFILVDVRSQEEYEEEHIRGAVNIPAYKDRDHSDYGAVERIVAAFKTLQEENPHKDIIVYCYSIPCMTGRKVGKILADRDIFVKELNVGWNEWRYYWELWNHPHEWETTNVEDYIWSGPEPGDPFNPELETGCPVEGPLGC